MKRSDQFLFAACLALAGNFAAHSQNQMNLYYEAFDLLNSYIYTDSLQHSTNPALGESEQATLSIDLGPSIWGPDFPAFLESHGEADGTVWSFARTGLLPHEASTFMDWEKHYVYPETPLSEASFTILPSHLKLFDYGGSGLIGEPNEMQAELFITVLINGQEAFTHLAMLVGRSGTTANHTFRIENEVRGDPSAQFYELVTDCSRCEDINGDPIPYDRWQTYGAEYRLDGMTVPIDLTSYGPGDAITVKYILGINALGDGGETVAEGFVGDPLSLSTGGIIDPGGLIPVDLPSVASPASCNSNVAATTPDSRFVIERAQVTDTATGLVWQRCPLGMTVDDKGTPAETSDDSCDGAAVELTWQEALQAAADAAVADPSLRLPNVKELASIVELQCAFPSINERAFPSTPGEGMWSNTPDASGVQFAWEVDFATGVVTASPFSAVRLARLIGVSETQPMEDLILADGFESQP